MTEQDVINAFLAGMKAEAAPLRSDGVRLYVGGDFIAEWCAQRLVIEPRRQDAASERCKDLLTHSILLRMSLHHEVRRLLRRNSRDLCAALPRGHRL
ncbi:MAG: hypothetical protein ABSA67_12645 [Candidatus Brocadiia bacterium]